LAAIPAFYLTVAQAWYGTLKVHKLRGDRLAPLALPPFSPRYVGTWCATCPCRPFSGQHRSNLPLPLMCSTSLQLFPPCSWRAATTLALVATMNLRQPLLRGPSPRPRYRSSRRGWPQ
jgi:hypothetical protein